MANRNSTTARSCIRVVRIVTPHELLRPLTAAESIDAPAGRFVPQEIDTAKPATVAAGFAVERPVQRAVRVERSGHHTRPSAT